MRDYTAMTAKELSELQQRHRQELQEKKAKIEHRKNLSQRIKSRGAIVTALMFDAGVLTDEEFYEKMKEILSVGVSDEN